MMAWRQLAVRICSSGRQGAARFLCALTVTCLNVFVSCSPATATYLITDLDENDYPGSTFQWGDFNYSGAVTEGASSLTLDIFNRDGMNNVSGGLGFNTASTNFDPGLAQWDVRFRVLDNNTANGFRVSYVDNDGGSSGTEYLYDFDIAGLPVNQWQTLSRAFTSPTFSQTASGHTAGDGIQNPGMEQMQFQSIYNSTGRLNIELDYVQANSLDNPLPAYPGAEPDAPWRAEAATRIDALRKADLQVTVTDALGNPLPNAAVGVHMQKHEFGFGSAIDGNAIADPVDANPTYQQKAAELFNIATVENHLKWQPWAGDWGSGFTHQEGIDTVDWLNQHGIAVRGHVLVWPGTGNLPSYVNDILAGGVTAGEQQVLRDAINDHIDELTGVFDGKLVAWDVVNETRANHDVMDNLPEGYDVMVDWYEHARDGQTGAKLFMNDYGIISSGGDTNSFNQNLYYNTIQNLIDGGAPIDGIGFQGHFSPGSITGPEDLWTIFDRFEQLGLKMEITEFDLDTTDEQLQADYTRDIMTAVFAHEGFDAFLQWGFWEGNHWRPNAAMFNEDWSIKPNGQAFLDLVFGEWWTDEDVDADALGEALVRAFKGEHEVSAAFGEYSDSVLATLSDGGLQLQIALPMLLGDYNGNGIVDAADYTVWRDSLGDFVDKGAGADGNGNGEIDEEDFLIWRQYFGNTLPTPGAGSTPAVPEPASALLCGLAALGFCWAYLQRIPGSRFF